MSEPKTLAELEEIQAKRQEEKAKVEDAQRAIDLAARMELEDKFGAIASVGVARFVQGHPTKAHVRTPEPVEYKKYLSQVHVGVDKKNLKLQREAQETLARVCWVYPATSEEREAMLEKFPGLLTSVGVAAAGLAEGRSEEEGKG